MSKVMTAEQFVAQLNAWGIKSHAIRNNWATHNRAGHGEFGDMHGIVVHHTGSKASTNDQDNILWFGLSNLPGPLCHAGIAIDGTVQLCGWGRANHAGLGDSAILNKVITEDYDASKTLRPSKADTDGNRCFYGFEIQYDGQTPMTDAQRQTIVRVCAAICSWHNWTEKSVIGHGEWQPGKWDPGAHGKLIDMGTFRAEVHQAIKEGAHPVKQAPAPKPSTKVITVVKGETLAGIATKNGVTLAALINANPGIIQPGDKLTIPNK